MSILLFACGNESNSVSPEDVLARSALASQQLTSARFDTKGTMHVTSPEGAANVLLNAQGILGSSGRQMQMVLQLDATVFPTEQDPFDVDAEMEVMLLEEDVTYFNLHRLAFDPDTGLLPRETVQRFQNTWWILESTGRGGMSAQSIAADPSFIRAQSQIVTVTKDLGIQSYGEYEVHHYQVAIDREKLAVYLRQTASMQGEAIDEEAVQDLVGQLQAVGELRIDTRTYLVHWLSWTIEPVEHLNGTVEGSFEVSVRDHNAAPHIAPPSSAQPFNPLLFFQDPSVPPAPVPVALPPGVDEEMIQQILEHQSDPPSSTP